MNMRVSGVPTGYLRIESPKTATNHFASDVARRPELILHAHAAVTNRHIIDCTDLVTVGRFTTFAGFRSQFLYALDRPYVGRQLSAPVSLGESSFVGMASSA